MSLFMQSILVSLIVWIGFLDKALIHTFLYRPIVIGPLVGLVFGNLPMGLQVGCTVELMFLAIVFVGTAIPPDETISAGVATALACLSGSAEVGIATALPVAMIGQIFRQTRNSTIYEFTMNRVEKAAEKASVKGMVVWTVIIPSIIEYILFGLPTFVAVYFGAEYVQAFIDFIPDKLVQGIAAGGGLLGAVGVALLLGTITDKTLWPFFILGFFLASYLEVNMLGVLFVAIVIIALVYYNDKKKEKDMSSNQEMDIEETSQSLTRKDLWKTYFWGLAIESGNSTTRQEANGFALGMVPTIEKVYSTQAEKAEAYSRHMQLFLTEGRMASFCIGISCAMEERYSKFKDISADTINSVKVALMGPLAGLGDSLIHGTLRPIMAGLAISLVKASDYNSMFGPILFLLVMTIVGLTVRYIGIFKGYKSGVNLVTNLQEGGMLDKLTRYSGIVAAIVCGGFIPALVYITLNVEFGAGDTVIVLQEILDGLVPNLIPLLYTIFMYYLINKKRINIILLMVITLLIGVAGVYLGILA